MSFKPSKITLQTFFLWL